MSYSADDLMKRYNVSRPGLLKFVNAHINEINKDGQVYAKKVGKEWVFDEAAVKVIDELKSRGVTVVDDALQADRIHELTERINELQQQLIKEKTANELAQGRIISLLEQQQKVVLLEQTTQRAEKAEIEVKHLQDQAQKDAEERGELRAQIQAKETELFQVQQRSDKQLADLQQRHAEEITNINNVNQANIEQLQKQHDAVKRKLQDDILAYENRSFWQKLKDLF